MKTVLKLALGALVSMSMLAGVAQAAGLKDPKDVRITFVVHGSASDPYWSVVKRGVDDAAALTGAKVEYYAPQVFDVVEQARLIDAAIATKPDGIAVSIADADALRKSVTGGDSPPTSRWWCSIPARRTGAETGHHALCRHRRPNMIPARRPASGWPRTACSRSSASTTRSAMSASTSAARA